MRYLPLPKESLSNYIKSERSQLSGTDRLPTNLLTNDNLEMKTRKHQTQLDTQKNELREVEVRQKNCTIRTY